jgi:hypothetical protein
VTLIDQLTVPQLQLALLLMDEPANSPDGILAALLEWLTTDEESTGVDPLGLLRWMAVNTRYQDRWADVLTALTAGYEGMSS